MNTSPRFTRSTREPSKTKTERAASRIHRQNRAGRQRAKIGEFITEQNLYANLTAEGGLFSLV